MKGSGVYAASDYLVPVIDAIEPSRTAMVPLRLDRYDLGSREVLDAIARVAGSPGLRSVSAYTEAGKSADVPSGVRSIDDLFASSRAQRVTYNVEYLERQVPAINAMAVDLSATFGGTVAVHAFVSGGGVPATPLHYDYSDAFTYQICGQKRWRCYEYLEEPVFGPGGYSVNKAAVGALSLDRVLDEGDCLFVPMGGLHWVESLVDRNSVHLAISVKPLGYGRIMARVLGPALDQPRWVGVEFEAHARQTYEAIRDHAIEAARSDVVESARSVLWHHLYDSFTRAPYPIRVRTEVPNIRKLSRSVGRPFSFQKSESGISLHFIDPDAKGPIGPFEFQPSRVELPLEAALFVEMLSAGAIDPGRLLDHYDAQSVDQLAGLAIQLGLFE